MVRRDQIYFLAEKTAQKADTLNFLYRLTISPTKDAETPLVRDKRHRSNWGHQDGAPKNQVVGKGHPFQASSDS